MIVAQNTLVTLALLSDRRGLIPGLVLAGGLSDKLNPRRILTFAQDRRGRNFIVVNVVALVLAAVLAEYFAIAEAVSARELEVSAFRVVFVAEFLAAATTLAAAIVVFPWLRVILPRFSPFALWIIFLAGTVVGSVLLTQAVDDASHKRDLAASYCINKESLANRRELLWVRDRMATVDRRLAALRAQSARAKKIRNPTERQRETKDVKSEYKAALDEQKIVGQYLLDVLGLDLPEDAKGIEELTISLGC